MIEDSLLKLKNKITVISDKLQTEESTKTAMVLPFIQMLNYDIFDPDQVIPEYNCDIVKNKGEKVDYALRVNNKIEIIIECKQLNVDLTPHKNQLARYFVSTKAKYVILTNGVEYQFYSDLDNLNLMDELPFFTFDINNYDQSDIEILENFSNGKFNSNQIRESASKSKLTAGILNNIQINLESPTLDILKIFTKNVYKGRYTDASIPKLTELFQEALALYIENKTGKTVNNQATPPEIITSKIQTTDEELTAYYIVKAIAQRVLPPEDIIMKDQVAKCNILYKNNNTLPIVKLYFNDTHNLQIELFDKEEPIKVAINSVNDIYDFENNIIKTCEKYSESNEGKKRTCFKFSMINIKPGDIVIFDPLKIKCIVIDDSTILYDNIKYTMSGFCRKYMPNDKRNVAEAYQGPRYFTYNGQILTDLRDKFEQNQENK